MPAQALESCQGYNSRRSHRPLDRDKSLTPRPGRWTGTNHSHPGHHSHPGQAPRSWATSCAGAAIHQIHRPNRTSSIQGNCTLPPYHRGPRWPLLSSSEPLAAPATDTTPTTGAPAASTRFDNEGGWGNPGPAHLLTVNWSHFFLSTSHTQQPLILPNKRMVESKG